MRALARAHLGSTLVLGQETLEHDLARSWNHNVVRLALDQLKGATCHCAHVGTLRHTVGCAQGKGTISAR